MAGGMKTAKLGSNLYPVLFFFPNWNKQLPVNNIEKTQSYILKDKFPLFFFLLHRAGSEIKPQGLGSRLTFSTHVSY
jgi:hypothetical protein